MADKKDDETTPLAPKDKAKEKADLEESEAAAQEGDDEATPLTDPKHNPKHHRSVPDQLPQGKATKDSSQKGSQRTISPASSEGPESIVSTEPRGRSQSFGPQDSVVASQPEDFSKSLTSLGSDVSDIQPKDLLKQRSKAAARRSIEAEDEETVMLDSQQDIPETVKKQKKAHLRGARRRRMSSQCAAFDVADIQNKKPKSKKSSRWPLFRARSKIDHSPHDMFVELDELTFCDDGQLKWVEKCRWIKFEEDVEEAAERWGKPHVASLSFRSLVDLRKCLKRGAILLDLPDEEPGEIGQSIVDQLVFIDQLEPEDKRAVLQCLLLKRVHVGHRKVAATPGGTQSPLPVRNLRERFRSSIRRDPKKSSTASPVKTPPPNSANSPAFPPLDKKTGSVESDVFGESHSKEKHQDHVKIDMDDDAAGKELDGNVPDVVTEPSSPASPTTRPPLCHRASIDLSYSISQALTDPARQTNIIMQRILENAEATIVLVGVVDFLQRPITAFVRLTEGRLLGHVTEVHLPVRFIFLLLGPKDPVMDYYEIGRAISALMSEPNFREAAYIAENRTDLLDAILDYLDESLVLPSGDWDKSTLLPVVEKAKKKAKKHIDEEEEVEHAEKEEDPYGDPLKRTKRPFGGLVNDIRRRYPKYLSDIKDGLNIQCLAAIFYIYFTSEKTNRWLGVSETLLGVAITGLIFAFTGGQPLLIVAATGYLIVFEEALYEVCTLTDIDFISFRCWVGFWVTIFCTLTVAVEGSFIIRYFTRFIQEIFSSLISLILILETLKKLVMIFFKHPLMDYYPPPGETIFDRCLHYFYDHLPPNITSDDILKSTIEPITDGHDDGYAAEKAIKFQPNTALLSIVLCFGTFFIAYWLKGFKHGKMLGRRAREVLGDFAVPIAIFVMVLVDFFIEDTYTEKLAVPDGINPTAGYKRGWFISPLGSSEKRLQVWAYFAAIVPAFLLYILIFMETEVTAMILDQKDNKLTKGSGYHLDLFLMGLFQTLCGLMGFPFVCPATLRSISHIGALSVWSQTHAPGEKAHLIEVKEQRVTAIVVHILIGVSVLMGPVLRQIPIAVLFGVFFYMGVAALHGIQLVERFKLMFMPVKHHPDVGYVRMVRPLKMHIYTLIQVACLVLLGVVKFTRASLSFPMILLLMVPFRLKFMPFIFTDKELAHLDCDVEEKVTKSQAKREELNDKTEKNEKNEKAA